MTGARFAPRPARRACSPIRLRVVAFAAVLLCSCSPGSRDDDAAPGPDTPVVLIVVDTLRADHLSLHGATRATSPSLEQLGARSAVFERAYASSPWTLPSFASIHTGLLPSRHSAGYLVPAGGSDRHPTARRMMIHGESTFFARLDDDVPTLAEMLRDAGYATGAIVNNPFLNRRFGVARGFDHYDHEDGGDVRSRRAREMVDRALAWIDAQSTKRFFVLVHLFDPHMNYDAPPPMRGRYTQGLESRFSLPIQNTPWLRRFAARLTDANRAFVTAAYDEEVAYVDAEIGRFVDALEARGLAHDALVVVTADHGEELFDHDSFGHGHTMFEEQLRVPLVVSGKGVVAARHATPVSIVDIAPTILDALDIEPVVAAYGVSLWDVVRGEAEPPARTLFAEWRGVPPEQKAVIRWPYKLSAEAEGGAMRLVDLASDPTETEDLSQTRPKLAASLAALLRQRYALEGADTPRDPAELDEATVDALKALGYVD